jgi:hypothetical protein
MPACDFRAEAFRVPAIGSGPWAAAVGRRRGLSRTGHRLGQALAEPGASR